MRTGVAAIQVAAASSLGSSMHRRRRRRRHRQAHRRRRRRRLLRHRPHTRRRRRGGSHHPSNRSDSRSVLPAEFTGCTAPHPCKRGYQQEGGRDSGGWCGSSCACSSSWCSRCSARHSSSTASAPAPCISPNSIDSTCAKVAPFFSFSRLGLLSHFLSRFRGGAFWELHWALVCSGQCVLNFDLASRLGVHPSIHPSNQAPSLHGLYFSMFLAISRRLPESRTERCLHACEHEQWNSPSAP